MSMDEESFYAGKICGAIDALQQLIEGLEVGIAQIELARPHVPADRIELFSAGEEVMRDVRQGVIEMADGYRKTADELSKNDPDSRNLMEEAA